MYTVRTLFTAAALCASLASAATAAEVPDQPLAWLSSPVTTDVRPFEGLGSCTPGARETLATLTARCRAGARLVLSTREVQLGTFNMMIFSQPIRNLTVRTEAGRELTVAAISTDDQSPPGTNGRTRWVLAPGWIRDPAPIIVTAETDRGTFSYVLPVRSTPPEEATISGFRLKGRRVTGRLWVRQPHTKVTVTLRIGKRTVSQTTRTLPVYQLDNAPIGGDELGLDLRYRLSKALAKRARFHGTITVDQRAPDRAPLTTVFHLRDARIG